MFILCYITSDAGGAFGSLEGDVLHCELVSLSPQRVPGLSVLDLEYRDEEHSIITFRVKRLYQKTLYCTLDHRNQRYLAEVGCIDLCLCNLWPFSCYSVVVLFIHTLLFVQTLGEGDTSALRNYWMHIY